MPKLSQLFCISILLGLFFYGNISAQEMKKKSVAQQQNPKLTQMHATKNTIRIRLPLFLIKPKRIPTWFL